MTIFTVRKLTEILKMSSIKCPYCPRTFSSKSKSAYTQHINHCFPPADSDNDESILISDMSLDSEEFVRDIEEVKRKKKKNTK